jgi:hypothetical protein
MAKEKFDSLRDWAEPSYDVKTGRAASSIEEAGTGSRGNHTTAVSAQISEATKSGHGGAPGTAAMTKSGSADPGRRKHGGSRLP